MHKQPMRAQESQEKTHVFDYQTLFEGLCMHYEYHKILEVKTEYTQ